MTTAVLLSCHGTIESVDDLPTFLANIRRGRPAPQAIVDEVRRRYERIGGSPLMRITRGQAELLEARLSIPVRVAGRLFHPYPEEVLAQLVQQGTTRIVSFPLAPQSVDIYHAEVRKAAAKFPGLELVCVPSWGLEPSLIRAFVESIEEALARFAEDIRATIPVILSAHSLPQRVVDAGDPYERDFVAMARAVSALLLPRPNPVRIAFQSQGMDGGAWLGPDLRTTFEALAGAPGIVVAPIGFLADHVETLYDLDVEAQDLATRVGFSRFERAPSMNCRPAFIDALEAVVRGLVL